MGSTGQCSFARGHASVLHTAARACARALEMDTARETGAWHTAREAVRRCISSASWRRAWASPRAAAAASAAVAACALETDLRACGSGACSWGRTAGVGAAGCGVWCQGLCR